MAEEKRVVPPLEEMDLTDEELDLISGAGAIGGVNMQSIVGMDLETALMSVQSRRASLIDEQLKQMQQSGANSQMDMLRMQSLMNKRNEAFDIMTNFIKKMQENRSSIIGNMR